MPRGVYDRTKTKAQREAEKTTAAKGAKAPKKAAKAPKAAPTKKAEQPVEKAQTLATKVSTSSKIETNELDIHSKFAIVRDNISTLGNTVHDLTTGTQTVLEWPIEKLVRALDDELKANIEVLTSLRREVFGLSKDEQAQASAVQTADEAPEDEPEDDDEDDEEDAPVAAVSQPYPQGTVPMPPAPVGVPPQ